MKRKLLLSILVTAFVFLMCSCAQPDDNTLIINKKEGDSINSPSLSDDNGESLNSNQHNIINDNNRYIKATYGSGEYAFRIDAVVDMPDIPIQSGTLINKDIDVSLIEQYLCNSETLIKANTDSESLTYVSDHNDVDNDLPYDIAFSLLGSGMALFQNFKLDFYFGGTEIQRISKEYRTNDQLKFVENMEQQAQKLFANLMLEAKVSHSWLDTGDGITYCAVFINSYLQGYPLISKDYGNYEQSVVNIADEGINIVNFNGVYSMHETKMVDIMNLDDVLNIIQEDVINKNISGYDKTIESIQLAYMTLLSDEGNIEFYPVWCFSGRLSSDSGLIPFLCINAQNGLVELMAGF